MVYSIEFSNEFERSMKKLKKKNKVMFEQIQKKLIDVVKNPEHYKPLGNILFGLRRIHFGSFVLLYSIDEKNKTVVLEDYDHHDKIYGK